MTETLAGSFSNRHTFEQSEAERKAREAEEESRRQRIMAERQRLQAFLDEARANPSTFDFSTLKTIDAHPDVAAAIKAHKAKRTEYSSAQSALDDAHATLAEREAAAARGHRDDAAITRAHEGISLGTSNVRIAAQAVAQAESALDDARERVKAAAFVSLQAEHQKAVRELAEVLKVAAVHSRRAAALEDVSRRLLARVYDVHGRTTAVVAPLPPAAWRKDFHPAKGFFKYWLKFHLKQEETPA